MSDTELKWILEPAPATCGCELHGIGVKLCPLHAAAPDLHRVVTFLLNRMNTDGKLPLSNARLEDGDQETIWNAMHNVITKVNPDDPILV